VKDKQEREIEFTPELLMQLESNQTQYYGNGWFRYISEGMCNGIHMAVTELYIDHN